MKILYKKNLLAIVVLVITSFSYAQNSAVYTDNRSGTLGDVPFTIAFTENPSSSYESEIDYKNFDIYHFRAARLGSTQPVFSFPYTVSSNLSVTFEQPIEDLKLYFSAARVEQIRFNHPFGFAEGAWNVTTVAGTNDINVTAYPGYVIIEFTEPVTTLTFTPLSVPGSGYQAITFADGDSLLGVDDVYTNANILKLYPSPSSDFIQISGLTATENYRIYNVIGAEVGSGAIFANKKIEVANLVNGLYFLKLESGNTLKFTKK